MLYLSLMDKKRGKFVGVNSITFNRQFKDDSSCYEYLASVKWDTEYRCKRCNCEKYCIHIMNLKGWLRGIHHHYSEDRLQGYLDEYHFRYNRRNTMNSIFDTLIKRMATYEPVRLKRSAV